MFIVECQSSIGWLTGANHTCGVRYTTDPLYTGLSKQFNVMLNTPLTIQKLSVNVTYYFEFSLPFNDSLVIIEQTEFLAPTGRIYMTCMLHN